MGTKVSIVAGLLLTFATIAYGDEIHVAAEKGDLKKVRSLIAANPSLVNVEGHQNTTPLHWAAAKGRKDVADFLISKKANLEAKDRYGFTPLLTAAQNGQKEVVELLLRHKANIEAKEKGDLGSGLTIDLLPDRELVVLDPNLSPRTKSLRLFLLAWLLSRQTSPQLRVERTPKKALVLLHQKSL